VLAMDDDTAAMYATVALERLAAGTEVIVRTNDVQNTRKLYRAGAEYALALSTVTGRMLASVLIQGEEVLTPETQFEIIRTNAPGLAGTTLADAAVRERTGATVVAIDRNGEIVANPDPEVPIQREDVLVVAGSDEAVNTFIETFA
ncbi:MAG: TrkA C-terminal domain-containing protein, partial [Natronomonas sp.]